MYKYFSIEFLIKEDEKHEPKAVHQTRKFYQACLNSTKGLSKC